MGDTHLLAVVGCKGKNLQFTYLNRKKNMDSSHRTGKINFSHCVTFSLHFCETYYSLTYITKLIYTYLTTDKTIYTCIMPPLRPMLNSN